MHDLEMAQFIIETFDGTWVSGLDVNTILVLPSLSWWLCNEYIGECPGKLK